MRLHRIYYPFNANLNETLNISNEKAHYLKHVIRLKKNSQLRIFNHQNQEFLAEVIKVNKNDMQVKLVEKIIGIHSSKLNITLVQGMSKGDRMDYTVQKATELGVNRIIPVISDYCEVKLNDKRRQKKLKHWQNIAISACEQCFRTDIPEVCPPITLQEYCQIQRTGLLLEPDEPHTLTELSQNNWQEFDVAVGPEGGWSQNDLQQLKSAGLQGIQFGQRILRTETMAPAIMAAIHSLWGDFI